MFKGQVSGDRVPPEFEALVQPHIESYDYFVNEGMQLVVERMEPVEINHPVTKNVLRIWFEDPNLARPIHSDVDPSSPMVKRLLPRECREAGLTYKAPLYIDLCYQLEGLPVQRLQTCVGSIPVMVKSHACHLRGMSRGQLVAAKEESTEFGGYFICNGIERIIRMLIQQRRHYIMAMRRAAFQKRGPNYTDLGTMLRCVRSDGYSASVRCHYLMDGTVNFAFTIGREEFFIPAGILLKCFLETSDLELYQKIVQSALVESSSDAAFVADRAELLLKQASRFGLRTRAQCLEYLGNHFRTALDSPPRRTDFQVGQQLLREFIFVHLSQPMEKLNLLLAMLQKLYALVAGVCAEDNPDALTHHEILLPGQLLCKFLQDKLAENLQIFKSHVKKDLDKNAAAVNFQDEKYIKQVADKLPDVGKKMEYLLNTGNLISRSGMDLSQAAGFTVVAEKLNFFRYLSHFRSVHRGAYFAELRTTTVRKLLPESWGFLCPVHTPDGSPCGLLNHFAAACRIVATPPEPPEDVRLAIEQVLAGLGMVPAEPGLVPPPLFSHLTVQVDGRVVGYLPAAAARPVVARLHAIKASTLAIQEQRSPPVPNLTVSERKVPCHLEVVHIPYQRGGTFPGLLLFTEAARMMRPVVLLAAKTPVLVGSLEQHNMSIRCPDGGVGGTPGTNFTHEEPSPTSMLSVVASLTPYSDFNQSPRNMYQCQMGKQTMGTPAQALPQRTDTKLYRIQTPQTPIARTQAYDRFHMDEFPNGTNMIVAVLAYTGYDMEDAMILNKAAVDRGLAHATVIKTEVIDLRSETGKDEAFGAVVAGPRDAATAGQRPVSALGQEFPQNVPSRDGSAAVKTRGLVAKGPQKDADRVDLDGLPIVGSVVYPKQGYYSKLDKHTGKVKTMELKGEEVAAVDQVTIVGSKDPELKRANIRMRYNRNPVIGDKFSSRHGQKGVLSQQWKDIDLPFCAATGMRPDLIINPHAFPSRMTIGMLLESLVSKAGALGGTFVDATPFQRASGRKDDPIASVADVLESCGFHRHGGETMVSGVTGEEFPAEIFIGPVYYQRLRHMVSDKFQVRSTGNVNPLTRQPIKGRKFGGGIRFGEMERDSLLAHGAAYLVHDRLHSCSDYHVMDVCASCGSLLSPAQAKAGAQAQQMLHLSTGADSDGRTPSQMSCRVCETGQNVRRVALPYVFRYLVAELAAMNIKCSLGVKA